MTLGLATLAATGAVFAAGGPSWAAPVEGKLQGQAKDSAPGSYVVTLKGGAFRGQSKTQLRAAVSASASTLSGRYGGKIGLQYSAAVQGFSVSGLSEDQAKRLAGDSSVESVEFDARFHKSGTQNNPPSWGLDRIDQRIGTSNTYTYPNTASGVTAYVVDSGLDKSDTDFGTRASWGQNFVDRIHNTYPDPTGNNQFNSNDPNNLTDCDGHGTHVSGTIGGTQYGVAKEINLVAVRVLDCNGIGFLSEIIGGIDYVTNNAVKPGVVNMSLGGASISTTLDAAIKRSIASGLTWTVAAGNGDANDNPLNACASSPGSVQQALVIGAVDQFDFKPSWANYGPCIDLFAPGVGITSDFPNNQVAVLDGTSMAAPHVAGAAALILGAHPGYTPDQVRQALIQSSTTGTGHNLGPNSPNRLLFVRQVDPPQMASKPTALYNPRFGTSEAYARSTANHVIYAYWSDDWSDWFDLGGDVVGEVAPLYNPRFGTTEVYARLSNNHIAYRYYSNGWSQWFDLGGNFAGNPAVIFNPKYGTTEVYGRTAAGELQYKYYSNGWSPDWINLHGTVASDPAVLYNPKYGTTEAYVRTTDNKLKYVYYLGGWSGWNDLGGTTAGNPAVIFNPTYGTTEVYTKTATNTLAYRYYLGGWGAWIDLGGSLNSDPGLVYNPKYGTTEAYARTATDETQYVYYLGGWSGWNNLGGSAVTAPSVIYNGKYKTTEVYTRTSANHGNMIYYANGWQPWTDISA